MEKIFEAQCRICGKYFKGNDEEIVGDNFVEHYLDCIEKEDLSDGEE
jgi:hypothetical protein